MRTFTQTLKFFFLACALVLVSNLASAGTWSTGSGDGEKHGGVWYVLYATDEQTIGVWGSKDYDLAGPGSQLTFDARHTYLGAGNLRVSQNQGTSVLYEGNPGISHWTSVDYDDYGPYSLDENTSIINFYAPTGVTGEKKFKNVKVTMASYCKYDNTEAISFGTGNYMVQSTLDKKIIWSNISNKDITITGTDKDRFSVSLTKVGCSVGKWGNTIVTVTYKRDKYDGGREHTATLNVNGNSITLKGTTTVATPRIIECATASAIAYQNAISGSTLTPGTAKHPTRDLTIDGTWTWQNGSLTADAYNTYTVVFTPDAKYDGGYSTQTCTISIPVTKLDQTISWDLTGGVEYATGQEMGATATSGLDVTYSSDHPEWGYINENGRLVVVEPNKEITITASQAGNENWNAADPVVTKTFTTKGANPNQFMDVEATSITYGDLLGESKFTPESKVYVDGVEIDGTLEWVDPAIMPNAGTAAHMVLFTPDNTAAYSSVYFEVPVTVAKANPVITWNIGNALRENTIYSNFVVSTNHEALLGSVTESSYLSIEGNKLTVGEIGDTKKTDIEITAHQVESANYNEVTSTHTITIYPKVPQCLPVTVNSERVMTNMGAEYVTPSGWCATTNTMEDRYFVPVKYTQFEGIQLGNWDQGLSGAFSSLRDLASSLFSLELEGTDKDIELKFTGIPDSLFFDTKLQTVSFDIDMFGDTYTPAKQKNPVWTVYERTIDGTESQIGGPYNAYTTTSIKLPLKTSTRSVRINIKSAFAGFIQNLTITRKNSITADKSSLTFGTETHPLQEPQTLTLSYSSLGDCDGTNDYISVTSSNPAFYVDEETITENVGIEQQGTYTIRVRCNDVNKSGTLTFTSNDGTSLEIPVSSEKPAITTSATAIFQTGTEHNPVSGTAYRAQRTLFTSDILEGLFNGSTPLFDTLYIYGVSESAAASRAWEYSPAKGYKVPVVTSENVHTPCFVYKKEGEQYTYVRTFDAATTTLNVADSKTRVFVGYRSEAPATTALQLESGAAVSLNNTEIVATNAAIAVSGNATIAARGANIVSSASKAAVQLTGTTTLAIEDSWKTGEPSGILALRPASGYPSIDLGSASGRVDIYGTQLELHNAASMAIAHMDGTTEKFDGEVHINDGSIGGAETLGMPKLTFIDGGTFNDGTVVAYTLKGQPKRPRNSRGEIVSRQTMTKTALEAYDWYGQDHLTLDGSAKVNPMLMDEEVWIFNGNAGESYNTAGSWNKGAVPGEDDDVLINAPMVISGGELKVKSLTINWVGTPEPAVTVNPNGGLTVGEGGIDGIKVNMVENLALKAGTDGVTKGQTGYLRVSPESAEPMPEATIELYSIGYYDRANATDDTNTAAWQCLGAPIEDAHVFAKSVYTQSWVYSWDESGNEWVNNRKNLEFEPFKGFETTQYKSVGGVLLTYAGQLVSGTEPRTIPLAVSAEEKGYNLLANSYTAPMVISQFQNTDFVNAESTIYILNAGTKDQSDNPDASKDAAGKFIGVPINLSPEALADAGYPTIVPSMQGFWVKAKKPGETAQLILDYSRLVWNQTYEDAKATKPLRAPKSQDVTEDPISGTLKVAIQANGWIDYIYLLESENFDTAYEDGYDAHRIPSGDMDIFTIENNDYLGLDATNSIIGTRVGVRTGEETTYTFRFSHIQSDKDLVLWDKETKMKVFIDEDIEYTFYAAPNSEITERFQIVAANIPTITTGTDEIENETHIQKFIKDNQLYILKDGVLYNASGAVVRK